jgi:hypothetical protein
VKSKIIWLTIAIFFGALFGGQLKAHACTLPHHPKPHPKHVAVKQSIEIQIESHLISEGYKSRIPVIRAAVLAEQKRHSLDNDHSQDQASR